MKDQVIRDRAQQLLRAVHARDQVSVRVLDQGEVTTAADGRAFVAAIVEVPAELLQPTVRVPRECCAGDCSSVHTMEVPATEVNLNEQ